MPFTDTDNRQPMPQCLADNLDVILGEGVGEAAGQLAAVGKVDPKEAFLEAVAGFPRNGICPLFSP